MNNKESENSFQNKDSESNISLIKSILNSKELSNILTSKLEKFMGNKRNIGGKTKYQGSLAKLEEGYESSDSEGSVNTVSTTMTSSTYSAYSSNFSDISSYNSDIQSITKENNNIQVDNFSKIYKDINDLKTVIPKEKSNKSSVINSNQVEGKNQKTISSYPLEFFEIFPNLKKFEISNQSTSQDFIEKPISFIKNLILKNYHESLLFTQNKFQLKNFKNSPDYQYKIMNISKPINSPTKCENITCMIHGFYKNNNVDTKNKNIENINSIIAKLKNTQNFFVNFIFFGYKNGLIIQYVLLDIKADYHSDNSLPADNFFLYREYSIENTIKEAKMDKHVLCMSLSDDENYLLAGYASSHIIIWKTTNGKIFYCFNDIFEMPVVACEFVNISQNERDFLFLAADLIGKIRLIHITKNTFRENHNTIIVSNCFYPCLLMKRLKFNKREGEMDFNINEIINKINNKSSICATGNLEYVELLMIHRTSLKITSVLLIKNPDLNILIPMTEEIKKNRAEFYSQKYLRENLSKIEFPDVSFGLGYLGDLIKNDNDTKEPYILFSISWKNRIILYYFSKDLNDIKEIGWFANNSSIIKIGFFGTSLIYFIDKHNNIKVINVKRFNLIEKINDNDNETDTDSFINFDICNYKMMKNKFLIPLSDIITIESPIKTISKTFTETINYFNPFIINCKYNIYLIQEYNINNNNKNNIRHIHLLSYQEFFNEAVKAEKWELFFCKFIDILKTNTNTFSLIPENKEKKENLLIEKKYNKSLKDNYLGYYLEQNFLKNEEEDDLDFFSDYNFLSVGIEFSIEIGSLDYIYNEIKKLKKQEKFKKDLVFQLEPFILNNKFQANSNLISEDLITEIINYYTSNERNKDDGIPFFEEIPDKLFKLDLILCHLNIEIVKKIKRIDEIIKKNKLFCSMIYYYSNCLNDFITPLQYLFEEFKNSKYTPIPKENSYTYFKKARQSRGFYRDNYSDLIRSLKTGNFYLEKNLFLSKEFIGHLLLSFIQLTLKGLLFPNIGKISEKIYDRIIPELFLFLTKRDIAIELISFDSFSYFETLTLFILREDEINKIVNDDSYEANFFNKNENNMNKKKFCPLNIEQIDLAKLQLNIKEYNDNNIKDKKENKINKNNKEINKENSDIIDKKENEDKIDKKEDKDMILNKDNNNKDNNNINNKENLKINKFFYELIYKIMELCDNKKNNLGNLIVKFDFYLFVIKISLKIGGISLKILDKALSSIFNFHNEIKIAKNAMDHNSFAQLFERIDKFRSHYTIIKRKQSNLDELSSIINMVIKKHYINNNSNNNSNSKNEIINNLLKMCSASHFLGVKIFLYELKKEYIFCINVFLNENRKISKRVFKFINKILNLLKDNKDEKNLQIFKNEIKKIISNLAGVSSSETFKIIQQWFNSKDIITNLNNLPKLQFKYLDKLKTIYKRKLKNEKSIESGNDTLKKEYSEILQIYIKLLFYFQREKRVLKLIKTEEEFINVKECLKICLNNSIDASIYLYKSIGDEKNALKICLDKIQKDFEEIIKNAPNTQGDLITNKFDEMKKLIDESIKICESYSESTEVYKRRKNSLLLKDNNNKINDGKDNESYDMGEEYWLELFNQIYSILNDAEKKNLHIFIKIKDYLSQKIENLLITMSYYVDFGFILKNVSNELEFSLFKKFLNKIFYTKSHLSNLYNSYINLLSCIINKNMKIVEINELEGESIRLTIKEENENKLEKEKLILDRFNKYNFNYNYSRNNELSDNNERVLKDNNGIYIEKNPKIFKKCCLCLKMINFTDNNKIENENDKDKADLVIFKCDHIYHNNCLLNEYNKIKKNIKVNAIKDNYCPICVNIENSIFSFISNEKDINNKNEINNINNIKGNEKKPYIKEDISSIEARIRKKEEKMKKKYLKKLNILDNNYFEQIDILQSTLNGI